MGDNDSFLDDKFLEDGFVVVVVVAGVGDLLFVALSGGLLYVLFAPGEVIDLNHHDFLDVVDLGVVPSSLLLFVVEAAATATNSSSCGILMIVFFVLLFLGVVPSSLTEILFSD